MPRPLDPSLNRRRLRIELRRAREKAELTQREAAEALEWSLSKIIRIEAGAVSLSVTDLRALLTRYGVTDAQLVSELEEAARGSKGQSWWTPFADVLNPPFTQYLGYESAADTVRTYHAIAVPGFLQTEDYAEALLAPQAPKEQVRRVVELRTARQDRLFEGDESPELMFVVDEAALRRRIGEPAVMRRQLQHLKNLMEHPRVTLQVLSFDAGAHYATLGSFILLGFKDDDDLLWLEHATGQIAVRDDHELIARYQECFALLTDMALKGDDAVALIDDAARDFGTS
ncbi:helix-turn-helix domain-containing protein [Streptomyces hyaluromycini]|uniref:helix-turn-helix domain-containing protein n=1 Tax=Streptomyces hyaluromycini TaxID=1377993 RepID=UPI000B5C355C|nr:helix-turn-helix transcriptional regulator [Streptomyces hyaluromycini]